MNIKQILTTVITILILIGLGVGVYVFFILKQTSAQPATSTTGQTNGLGSDVNVPNPTQTQTQGNVTQDIDAGYAALFAKIGAEKIKFNTVTSGAGELGSVYSLYATDVADAKKAFPKLAVFSMSIALVDLNKDGVTEAVVWENLPGVCGSAGCPLEIYMKAGGKWAQIYSGLGGSTIGIGKTYTGGYADLFLTNGGEVGYQSNIVRYIWHKTDYVAANTIATWDGSQFIQK